MKHRRRQSLRRNVLACSNACPVSSRRTERINQQHRDDVVNRLRTELGHEHDAQLQQLTAQHQQQVQQLQ